MSQSFSNADGRLILERLIAVIHENKVWLSEIDGAIGDGDHGINMNKGFTLFERELAEKDMDLATGLTQLAMILMMKIGGSMGPLYGMFFQAMGQAAAGKEIVDAETVSSMLGGALSTLQTISDAKPGDKTLMDVLVPAAATYDEALKQGNNMTEALARMKKAAFDGRDSTKDMISRKGRSSRLGERSRGVLDAGASSCALILGTMADTIEELTS